MFNNVIYFIVVLVIFSVSQPDTPQNSTLLYLLFMLFATWLIFVAYCNWAFRTIHKRYNSREVKHGLLSAQYHRLLVRLSVLAIFLFSLDVYLLNLKYWIQMIPGSEYLSFLQEIVALLLFFFYLSTIWYFACPVYCALFRQEIKRYSYVVSNLRLNFPFLIPWMALSLVYDFLAMSSWAGEGGFYIGTAGDILFHAGLIIAIMIFMPGIIQYWWGCKPFSMSEQAEELEAFLRDKGFRYRRLLRWPIFQGRMMTAGIMGIVARYRYILVTDSLMEILSTEELKAVLAHEMGHAKYHHMLFYMLFLIGLIVIFTGLQELFPCIYYLSPFVMKLLYSKDPQAINLLLLIQTVPMLIVLVVYFRYLMGFFMRNFERQADLYSVKIMGTPVPIIKSLEKIAYFSGKIRNLPSWHHFSIRERTDCLSRTLDDPGLIRRHNRFVAVSFLVYLVGVSFLGYALNNSVLKKHMIYSLAATSLKKQIQDEPDNIILYKEFAAVSHELRVFEDAAYAYEKIIAFDPDNAMSLNNLAWIIVKTPDVNLRDKERALDLAKKAVALEPSPEYLDTLAEAYYVSGYIDEAVKSINEAISVAGEKREYYEGQLEKFRLETYRSQEKEMGRR